MQYNWEIPCKISLVHLLTNSIGNGQLAIYSDKQTLLRPSRWVKSAKVLISGIILIYNWIDCFAQTPETMKFNCLVNNVINSLYMKHWEKTYKMFDISRLCILSFGCNRPEELFIYNWPDLSMRTHYTWLEMSSTTIFSSYDLRSDLRFAK